ncbi:LysE family translocator [Bartonella sp. B41]
MSFFPEWSIIIQFSLASLVLALTPGPDIMLSVGCTIRQSKKAGIMCALGSATGLVIQVIAVAFGLSALIVASPHTFSLLKIVGAFYLLWLAFQALYKHSKFSPQETSLQYKSLKRNYLTAVGINLLNPKAVLFNMIFLPQFVHANDPMVTPKLLILGLFHIPISLPINILIVFMANKLSKGLQKNPSYLRFLDWLIACIFTSFALRIFINKN